jgi:thioredoxin 1
VWLFRKCGPPLFVVFCDPVTEAGRHLGYTKTIEQQTHPQEVEDMEPITITTENFDAEVLHSEKPVLLDFWASWCGPCRMLSPIVDEVAEERSDVKVGKVNVDEQPDLAAEFGVMSIPTLLLFENGKLVRQAVGARPKSGVLELLG